VSLQAFGAVPTRPDFVPETRRRPAAVQSGHRRGNHHRRTKFDRRSSRHLLFVVAYLGVGLPPVLLTAATYLISSRSALIGFSAVILVVSVIAARLQAKALRH
jgi:hypothetical protein